MAERWQGKFEQVDAYRWEIPASYKAGMRVPGLIYADAAMLAQIQQDLSPEQVANVAFLPGIVGHSLAMPDIHWGYGFPIGGVAGIRAKDGVISPGGVGFDINCGVRLLRTDLTEEEVRAWDLLVLPHILRLFCQLTLSYLMSHIPNPFPLFQQLRLEVLLFFLFRTAI